MKKLVISVTLLIIFLSLPVPASFSQEKEDLPMSLKECVEIALGKNPDLQSEKIVIDKFYRALEEKNRGRLPEIFLEYSGGGGVLFDSNDILTSEVGIVVSQPLYHGGEITYDQEEALLNYEKELFGYDALKDTVIYEAYIYYYDLVRQNKLLEIGYADLERSNLLLSISEARFRAGDIAEIEVLKAQVEVAQSQDNIIANQARKDDSNDRLTRFLELNYETEIITTEEIEYNPFLSTQEECIEIAINNKPQLKSSLLDIDLAQIALEKVKNDILPEIDIVSTLRYGSQTDTLPAETCQVFLNATWIFPVYDRGKRENQIKDSEADIEIKEINYNEVEKDVILQIRTAYRNLKTLESRIELREKIVDQAEQSQIATQLQYETGFATILEVTTTSQALTAAKINAMESLIDYHLAKENLSFIMGTIGNDMEKLNRPEE